MDVDSIDPQVVEIVNRRLQEVPSQLTHILPQIVFNGAYSTHLTQTHFILYFADERAFQRIQGLIDQGYHPFPCLIVTENMDPSTPTAFRFDNSRNVMLESLSVEGSHSLFLGKDSTLVVRDHRQFCRIDSRVLNYVIDLAYIISFGFEINQFNYLHFLDDLIAYSLKQWKSRHAR